MNSFWIVSGTCLGLLVACSTSSNNSPTSPSKISVGTAEAGDMSVELLTDDKLETGLIPIYIKVTNADNRAVTDARVTFLPMMSMATGMSHSCPVFGPPTIGQNDLYHVDVVFQMASTDADTWSATVGINDTDAETNDATISPLNVPDSGRTQVFTYTDPVSSVATRYISSLNFVKAPQVGLNPVVFTLHTRQDMMTFPPVEDAVLTLDPEMPSMGHGSSGNINPTKTTTSGRYEGQVSLSMAGTWDINVSVQVGDVTVGTPKFTISF